MGYFSTGVTRDKLMVLYGLKSLGMQPTKAQLADFFCIYDLLGYFEVQNASYELEEEGLISAVPRPYGQAYFVTPQGEQTLDMFAVELPSSLRDKIAARAKELNILNDEIALYNYAVYALGSENFMMEDTLPRIRRLANYGK